ncbi:MAG TPA: DEAD/DEAH box helicase [Polyangia bacterium]|jgi:ATP-dependent RNA helicase DeaD|nr:DEAD/DEAH box helicase [Polyangia bacterium]
MQSPPDAPAQDPTTNPAQQQTFADLDLPAPLLEAISKRGYERPTAVQAAVAGAEHAGRDLLVSSETGSGKTLAFGIALAEALLESEPTREPGTPRALVVTPTRELATQVQGELQWLYAHSRIRLGVFTGGTDVRGDLARLRPGLDLAVGTPGRLVDLLRRGSLRLHRVRAIVLDEADEMLDMGFREDLEMLLAARADAAASEDDRARTLLFSATLPEPILAMAARYQRNAVRVDARRRANAGAAHEDIHYVAHLVAMGEKLPAVINVLRRHRGVRAIVFGTTRDGVADLHRQLVNRGFRAVVLSGDRAQSERTRSLAALRDGEADLLVATNVAARGLDLPEVDLVLHADLPLNAEALTHRSGRTGRAGRKGTSVLIATLAERRKAERLLGSARVPFTWTAAPSEREIARAAEEELATALIAEASRSDAPELADARELAARLAADVDRDALLTALLARELGRLPTGEAMTEVDLRGRPSAKPGARPARGEFSRGAVLFEVNLGHSQKAEPGWLLPLICRRGGVTRREVGAIRVGPQSSQFEIAGEAAAEFALAAGETDPRAPHVRIRHVEGAPSARPERHQPRPAPRADRAQRPPARPTRDEPSPHHRAEKSEQPVSEPTLPDVPSRPKTDAPPEPRHPRHARPEVPIEHKRHKRPEAREDERPHQAGDKRPHAQHEKRAHGPHDKRAHATHEKRSPAPHEKRSGARPSDFGRESGGGWMAGIRREDQRAPESAQRRQPPRAEPSTAEGAGRSPPLKGHAVWRPPSRRPQPAPHKAGSRRPPRPR